jgi:Agenet domain
MKKTFLFLCLVFINLCVFAQVKTTNKTTKTKASTDRKYAVGAKVETEFGNSWYPSTIIKMQGDSFLVHYDEYDDSWNEWVKKNKLRFPEVKSTVASENGANNEGELTINDIVLSNVCDYSVIFYFSFNGNTESVIVERKSTYNKKVYNGTLVSQKAKGYGEMDKGKITNQTSMITSSCE